MKNVLVLIIVAALNFSINAENLLVNPDAETGNMNGWTVSPSGIASSSTNLKESTGTVEPYAGNRFFRFNRGSFGTIYQEVDLPETEMSYIYAGGFMNNELWPDGIDSGELVITCFDPNDKVITDYSTGELAYAFRGDAVVGAEGYGRFGLVVAIPEDVTKVRYQINGYLHGGSYINTFVDALFLTLMPNPSDFNNSDYIDLFDFEPFSAKWNTKQGNMVWNPRFDIAQPPDGIIDLKDLTEFTYDWLLFLE